jgi:hypothetical protein
VHDVAAIIALPVPPHKRTNIDKYQSFFYLDCGLMTMEPKVGLFVEAERGAADLATR